MYVYCVESFAHIKCYSDCSHRGSHLVEPFAVCRAVTVECCVLYPCSVFAVKEEGFYPVSAITERRDMGLGELPLSMSVLGYDVSQLPYVWYYVGVKSSFQHAREECESKRAYVF